MRDTDWRCVIMASEMVERSTRSNIHLGQLPAWERKVRLYYVIDMSKCARPEVTRNANPLYQTQVRNLVKPTCIPKSTSCLRGCPSQMRTIVPIAEGTPTFSPARSGSRLGRIDGDAAPAHAQWGIAPGRGDASKCGVDHADASIGFDSAPIDHHPNQSGTLPPSAYDRDASSNRECCGAASR